MGRQTTHLLDIAVGRPAAGPRVARSWASETVQVGAALPAPAFLEMMLVRFGVADASSRDQVPVLLSPFGYATCRAS